MAAHAISITSLKNAAQPAPVLRKATLACGIAAPLLYVVMMEAIRYDGYSATSQVVSELSAIGAPTRTLWFWVAWVYTALMIAFGLGVWKAAAGGNRPLRIAGGAILTSSLLGFVWPFAPMHQRAVLAEGGGSLTDAMHIALSVVTVFLFLLTVGFGAAAFGTRFRVYSIATIVTVLAFGALTGVDGPKISANLPTPWVGLWERINIGAYMVWLVVLAITILRPGDTTPADAGSGSSPRGAG